MIFKSVKITGRNFAILNVCVANHYDCTIHPYKYKFLVFNFVIDCQCILKPYIKLVRTASAVILSTCCRLTRQECRATCQSAPSFYDRIMILFYLVYVKNAGTWTYSALAMSDLLFLYLTSNLIFSSSASTIYPFSNFL